MVRSEDEVGVGHEAPSTGNTVLQVVSLGQRHRVQVGVPTSVSEFSQDEGLTGNSQLIRMYRYR